MTPDQIARANDLLFHKGRLEWALRCDRLVIAEKDPDVSRSHQLSEVPLRQPPDLRPYVAAELERVEAELREMGVRL